MDNKIKVICYPGLDNPLTSVLSVREASYFFGVSVDTIYYHIDQGHLTFRQIEKGVYLIDLNSLTSLSRRLRWVEKDIFLSESVQKQII